MYDIVHPSPRPFCYRVLHVYSKTQVIVTMTIVGIL